jgi:hypothetical protein
VKAIVSDELRPWLRLTVTAKGWPFTSDVTADRKVTTGSAADPVAPDTVITVMPGEPML